MPEPWWKTELYTISSLTPSLDINHLAGPKGPAYVQVYDKDRTAPGWGKDEFMPKYLARRFSVRRAEVIYERHQTPFALVMRSMKMVCIDIDGKNDGIASAASLLLPPTLAETSRSGNGFHLFYVVEDDWDDQWGYRVLGDKIGFMQGVDLRGTGCVYHYPHQQWNTRLPVLLPQHVRDKINARPSVEKSVKFIQQTLESDDPLEIAIMQDTIQARLNSPVPQGKRNNTLFAIGAEMAQAQITNWEQQIYDRAIELGIDDAEATKLVTNIRKYA